MRGDPDPGKWRVVRSSAERAHGFLIGLHRQDCRTSYGSDYTGCVTMRTRCVQRIVHTAVGTRGLPSRESVHVESAGAGQMCRVT